MTQPNDPKNLAIADRFAEMESGAEVIMHSSFFGLNANGYYFRNSVGTRGIYDGELRDLLNPKVMVCRYTPPLPELVQVEDHRDVEIATGPHGCRIRMRRKKSDLEVFCSDKPAAIRGFNALAHIVDNSPIGQQIIKLMEGT